MCFILVGPVWGRCAGVAGAWFLLTADVTTNCSGILSGGASHELGAELVALCNCITHNIVLAICVALPYKVQHWTRAEPQNVAQPPSVKRTS